MSDVADHQRPDLTPVPCKPDVLVRLNELHRWWITPGELATSQLAAAVEATLADAIDAISGLRASGDLRLTMINDLKRELAELRPEEGR